MGLMVHENYLNAVSKKSWAELFNIVSQILELLIAKASGLTSPLRGFAGSSFAWSILSAPGVLPPLTELDAGRPVDLALLNRLPSKLPRTRAVES